MNVRVLVVDIGSVLFAFDPDRRLALLARRTGMPAAFLHRRLFASGFETRCEAGEFTADEIAAEVRDRTGFDGGAEELSALWTSAFTLDAAVLDALTATELPLAIFSNNGPLFADYFDARFPEAAQWFRHRCFASGLKARKPEAAAFALVERRLEASFGSAPGDLTLIDDNGDNTAAASARGWRAHTFAGVAGLREALAGT
ncbi:hypothetical protein [Glycomyces paridis]|uniref:HAD family phosphatase n=1 Tax=Glycomyces paridis TaxID=2126555 RepID=A0A4S8PAJ2_9ACTN|nr:hypothetical protein [Glycomyces paridis]THV27287.1 hypothetical protein E9998_15635 [Glycomyces paridis]